MIIPILFGRALVDPFQGFAVHTLRVGDMLSGIANEFYGDPARFRMIFAANRDASASAGPGRQDGVRACRTFEGLD